jgi:hypothetical protein
MSNTVKFPFSIVDDLELPWVNIDEKIIDVDDHGWTTHEIVFDYGGELYRTFYYTSENGMHWNDYGISCPEFIYCVKVKPVQKMITVYEEV